MQARAEEADIPTKTILLEAAGEPYVGQVAVGNVIRKRARERKLTFDQVCLEKAQFSAWNDKAWADKRLQDATGQEYQIAAKAWAESEDNRVVNANLYHTLDSTPAWHKTTPLIAIVGRHCFHRETR